MDRIRMTLAFACLCAACVAGLWLSGALTLRLLGIAGAEAGWTTWLDYLRVLGHPDVAPHAGRIRLAGAIGLGLPLLAAGVPAFLLLRPRRRSLHGRARFANAVELARRGLFTRSGQAIVVGRWFGRLLRFDGQQSVLLAAPTRSGKGVGVVVPNLLDYLGSVVVLDIKQENFALTSGWRRAQGQAVHLFNPFAEDRRTQRWNPLSYVSTEPLQRVSDLQGIANLLYPDAGPEQKFWTSQARNAFLAFALYLYDHYEAQCRDGMPVEFHLFPTLGRVFRLSSAEGATARQHLQDLASRPFLGEHARRAFGNLLSQAEETFASILGSFREPLNPWIDPLLDAATSGNDFLLDDLRRRPMTVYVGVPPHRLAEARPLLNLFFSQLINLNTRVLPGDDPALRHPCLLLMDEFTALGRIDIIATAMAYMAGYNLRLLPVIQSMAQLDAVYGKDVARAIATNHAMQVVFAPREQQDANDYSEMLGYTSLRRRNLTRGRSRREVSRSESEERRALMLPQELKSMDPKREIVFCEGLAHPVRCAKIRYYADRRYRSRLLPPVAIPPLPTT
ncbi:type IV secretory system conjugative DNA transfer family protein [Luteimonas sp. MC1750]|uniref:type IV secretory system conjugative DNA transfer family protein n=1 Tax=Luteimonas sp. MC1750 TaxID=2799326 RepID=UPI0018F0E340|nr:type IV secretory system conjugative DNA transfer family protein [Luteimonas sp. MC1750]MBJ6983703.1 type IV secretory system conjugative DNA transfer family protein [Luteimonas sp. MC1750]QQO06540.1 type IV secretory system conjugative DNA transfer family protein [Luteimonas sp. MC1750]